MHISARPLVVATSVAALLLLAGASPLHARASEPSLLHRDFTHPVTGRLAQPFAPAATFAAPVRAATTLAPQGAEPRRGGPISVTLAFVDSLPRVEALATVVRRGGARPTNLVLLRRATATPTVLAGALAALSAQRRSAGDTGDGETRITMTHAEFAPVSRGDEARFAAMFQKLSRAEVREVAGFGRLQAVDVTVGDPSAGAP